MSTRMTEKDWKELSERWRHDKPENEEWIQEILIYVCGMLEKISTETKLFNGPSSLLTDFAREIFDKFIEDEYSPSHYDIVIATIGILEAAQLMRTAVTQDVFGTIGNPN